LYIPSKYDPEIKPGARVIIIREIPLDDSGMHQASWADGMIGTVVRVNETATFWPYIVDIDEDPSGILCSCAEVKHYPKTAEKPPKPFKVVCVYAQDGRAEREFTPGKVYTITPKANGDLRITSDRTANDGFYLRAQKTEDSYFVQWGPADYARFVPFLGE
jgi:hypothetical protein